MTWPTTSLLASVEIIISGYPAPRTISYYAPIGVSLTGISFSNFLRGSERLTSVSVPPRVRSILLSASRGFQTMPDAAVYVIPDADFDDWIVRTDAGDEVAHFATREAAELVAQQIARERGIDLVVHLPDGRTTRKSFAKG